ncbi:MAG: carboxypeptidase regulatory-like domain-containing protein [Thermoplasmata archaeon]
MEPPDPTSRRALPFAARRRPGASLALSLLVVAVALLMVPAPGVGALSSPSPPAAPSTPTAVPTSVAHPAAVPSSGLAGSSGANTPAGPALSTIDRFANFSLSIGATAPASSAAAARTASTSAGPGTGPSGDSATYLPTGTFNVFVANASNPSDFLSGVSAQAYPETGAQFCPSYLCQAVATGPGGEVNVTCPVGPSYLTFTKGDWAVNETYATCDLNQTVDLGTVYLLPDGFISGKVLADVAGGHPLAGVIVQGESRDFSVIAEPQVTTSSNGNFTVPIPPGVAGRVDFTAPSDNYQNNFTFVSAAAGQTVDVGFVYLEPNSLVEAQLYDSVTHQSLSGDLASLTVCSSVTGICGTQGASSTTGTVEAVGTPGYDFVQAEAVGYMLNDSPIGNVPGTNPTHPYCVPNDCKIYLTTVGYVQFTVDVSGTPSPTYHTGLWTVSDCGLDGYFLAFPKLNPSTYTFNTSLSDCIGSGCVPVGTTYDAPAFAFRNDIQIAPDTTGVCNPGPPPTPMWPIPTDLPVWGNETAANVTPYETTDIGYLNLTPGSYVYGNVTMTGTLSAPRGGFAVQIQSRISPALATYPFQSGRSANACSSAGHGSTFFCAAAPPGPDQIVVSATGVPSNETWFSVPWQCCNEQRYPFSLGELTLPEVGSVNLTPEAVVNGSVVIAGGSETVPYSSVTVCPTSPTSEAVCGEGLVNRTGEFSVSEVPPGWDVLHGSGSGYAPNSQWFYVGSGDVTLPPLPLTPLATLEGLVVSTNGSAIIDASIAVCTLAAGVSSQSCSAPLGSGLTTTDGYYQGLVPGGWLPGATYEVEASAPGFESDWTWVNATVNQTTVVPRLVLSPVGASGTPSRAGHAFAQSGSAGSWVVGRLVDNATLRGVSTSGISGCAVSSGVCTAFPDGSDSGGYFNGSLPAGVYNLTIQAVGYAPGLVLVTIPLFAPVVDVGTIALNSLPWVFGHIATNWTTIAINASGHPTAHVPIAAPATLLACGLNCGEASPDATSGQFQTQGYYGHGDTLFVNPSYPGSYTSAAGGFNPAVATFNDTTPTLNLSFVPITVLYVAVSGTVYNNASCTPGPTGTVCTDPARWATVTVTTTGVNNGAAIAVANGGGGYTCFLPGDNDEGATRVTALDSNFYFRSLEIVNAQLGALGPGWNLTWVANPLDLVQFGYAYATVVNSVTGLPIVGTGISSSFNDPLNGNSGSTSGATNGAGFANITAPSGTSVDFTIGGSNDYNFTAFSAPVPVGNATDLNTWYSALGGPVALPPWGWVEGQYINYTAPTGFAGTVLDRANDLPLSGASVSVTSADPAIPSGGSSQSTNSLGEFLADAPIGPSDTLVVSLAAYEANITHPLDITPGLTRVFPSVDLTGDGVLASQVIAEPGGVPVAGASVAVCAGASPAHQTCETTITNATGHYWVDVAPGNVSITVTATGYVSNYTQLAIAHSDTWTGIPVFEVVEDGVLEGTVRGLPTGLPVGGALVGACSPDGVPTGPCNFQVHALSDGIFSLPVAPSTYVLATAAVGFNTSYLPVSVRPGETVDLGIVLLTEFGILTGTVVNSVTDLPVANATVGGCPTDSLLPCDIPTSTDLSGTYHIASPPGAVDLVVSARGYLDGYLRVNAVSGTTVLLPTITIAPMANESTVYVSGKVVVALDPSEPIAAATVGLWAGSALASSVVASATGTFSLAVPSGAYALEARSPGYTPARENLVLTESVSGIVLALSSFGWSVTGTVRDGLTNATIPSVAIWSSAGLVAITNASGVFSAALPNGTYNLSAVAGGSSASLYAPVGFQLQVAASSVDRPVWLYPASETLVGEVESSVNQSAIVGAQVTVQGIAVDGAVRELTGITDGAGRFSIPMVYLGSYSVTFSATGYHGATVQVTAGVSNAPLMVQLGPVASSASGAPLSAWSYTFLALGLIGGIVVVMAFLGRRRPGRSP